MASVTECRPAPVGPCSPPAVVRDASASPSDFLSLRRASDFRRVLSSGRRSRRGGITVALHEGEGPGPRVGLVVGRKVGNAVLRNRAKRRLRHAMKNLSLEQGMDYVIIADREVLEIPFEELTGRLRRAIEACR